MKIRMDFVTNSSSVCYIFGGKNGNSLNKESLFRLIKYIDNELLFYIKLLDEQVKKVRIEPVYIHEDVFIDIEMHTYFDIVEQQRKEYKKLLPYRKFLEKDNWIQNEAAKILTNSYFDIPVDKFLRLYTDETAINILMQHVNCKGWKEIISGFGIELYDFKQDDSLYYGTFTYDEMLSYLLKQYVDFNDNDTYYLKLLHSELGEGAIYASEDSFLGLEEDILSIYSELAIKMD